MAKKYRVVLINNHGDTILEKNVDYTVLDEGGEVCSDLLPNSFVVEIEDAIKEDLE